MTESICDTIARVLKTLDETDIDRSQPYWMVLRGETVNHLFGTNFKHNVLYQVVYTDSGVRYNELNPIQETHIECLQSTSPCQTGKCDGQHTVCTLACCMDKEQRDKLIGD